MSKANVSLERPNWYVYIVRCADDSLYTGIAKDLDKRIHEHNFDNRMAARYTRARRPITLIYQEKHPNRSEASKREASIKKLNRKEKELLINKS